VTEERQPDSTGEGTADSTGDAVEQQPKSVEEVEAFWRNRFSARDRAHNAETAALRAQMEAMQRAPVAPIEGESPEAARVRELQAELAQERAARQAESLKSQYPMAAAVLGDAIVQLPPEKIAAIEASYDNGGPAGAPLMVDPNAARRGAPGLPGQGPKPLQEKSKDELLSDLRRMAPAYQEALKEGSI
jgi:hypothetical protein